MCVQVEKVLSKQKVAFAENEFWTKDYQVCFEVFPHMGYSHPVSELQYHNFCGVQIKQAIYLKSTKKLIYWYALLGMGESKKKKRPNHI